MDQTRKIMIFAVVIASALIIWWVGIYPEPPEVEQEVVASEEQPPVTTDEDIVADRTSEAIGRGRGGQGQIPPFDPNQMAGGLADAGARGARGGFDAADGQTFGRGGGRTTMSGRGRTQQIDPNEVSDPNDPMVSVAITNLRLNQIIDTLMEWTGKSVIPSDEATGLVVTAYSQNRLPRSEALSLLIDAMFMQGFVARENEKTIYIVPASDIPSTTDIPLLDVDDILALYPNKEDVVQKFFRLKNYSPSVMANILTPMLGDSGYSIANDETGSLAIIDTVKRLIGYERVIKQYDSEVTAGIESQTFELKYRVAAEVVEFLEQVLSSTGSSITSTQNNMQRGRGGRNNQDQSVNAATIEAGGSSLQLITEPINNWIIAKASSEYMDIIESWIDKIDIEAPLIEEGTSLVSIDNIQQIAQRAFQLENYSPSEMAELVEPMVSEDDGWITAEERTGTLVVKDRIINLIEIEKYIEMFDVPEASPTVIQTFTINRADVTELAQLIELILTGEGVAISTSSRTTTGGRTTTTRSR